MASRLPRDPLASLNLAGAVPLNPTPRPPAATSAGPAGPSGPASPGAAGAGQPNVVEVTEANFATEVLERSRQVPVVLDFWATWCQPCLQLSPILEKLAEEGAGSWVLAKIDVDANPRVAQALEVQGIPAVKAVVDGGLAAEFTGALPEPEVRKWIAALLEATGALAAERSGEQPPVPAEILEAEAAFERGDLDGAEAAYRRRGDQVPGDQDVRSGLARIALLRRTASYPADALDGPVSYLPADLVVRTDLLVVTGQVEEALALLVEGVRQHSGAERDAVRAQLLMIFEVLGDLDDRVPPARRALAAALF